MLFVGFIIRSSAQSDVPVFSSPEAPVYFKIQFKTGGCFLQENGENALLTTNIAAQKDGQLFAFIGTQNSFVLLSSSGRFVGMKHATATNGQSADLFCAVAEQSKATTLSLVNSNAGSGYFEITKSPDKSKAMNQWGGATHGVNLGLWTVGDVNNPLFFVNPDEVTEYEVVGASAFMPERKHTLWYNRPATLTNAANVWMEYSLPIGNGQLGASLLGGVKKDEIQFNEKTLWTGGPNDMGTYGKYLNFGNLSVTNLSDHLFDAAAGKKVLGYVRFLDIEQGVGGVNFTDADGTAYTRRYIASEPDGVVAVQYKTVGNHRLSLLFSVKPGEETNSSTVAYTSNGEGHFSGKLTTVYHHFRFKVVPVDGSIARTDKGIEVKDASEVLLVFSGATTFDSSEASRTKGDAATVAEKVKSTVNAAAAKGWKALYDAHVQNFTSYTDRVHLNIKNSVSRRDTESLVNYYNAADANKSTAEGLFLEQLYFHFGRYLGISSSRGVNVPSNLQGIWNDRPDAPWNSDIHTNINVQMNYWPAEPTHLGDCHLPFLNFIIDNAQSANWQRAARRGGQDKGWTVFTESNIFGGMSTWGDNYFVANAWYVSHLWQHYRYTLDKEFLKRAFPAMWSSAEFWMGRMVKDRIAKDGTWVCPDEYSPEQNDHPKEDAPAHAQQLVTANLQSCMEAINVLGMADAGLTPNDRSRLQDYIKNTDTGLHLEDYKGDWGSWATHNGIKKGDKLLKEWKYTPYSISSDKGHRHMSHLMCLYPLNQVRQGDGYYEAAVNALKLRGDAATGWSMGWKVNLWARAKDGNHARTIIKNALKHSTSYGVDQYAGGIYYNLYDSHAPFQIDGNFGVCAGIAELLLQSQNDVIELLPALPEAWTLGSITGLKAVGNFTVDIHWNNGKPSKVEITSNKGMPLRVSGGMLDAVEVLIDGRGAEVVAEERTEGRATVYQIRNVKAGQKVSIDFNRPAVPASIPTVSIPAGASANYDICGRRISPDAGGLVISKGKKVFRPSVSSF